MGAAGAAAGIGCSIVVSLVFFIVGGVILDRLTDRSPLFTLIGVVIGLIAAGYELLELSRVGRPDRAPGPLTRQITRLPIGRQQSTSESDTDWPQAQNGEEE
ncbi:MAG TPA: AtpZ/AtpI family protein [Thermomicrobiales bacterium]|nr:AtpZ/AtpI family protein [Thermomicrobiales bacterium]